MAFCAGLHGGDSRKSIRVGVDQSPPFYCIQTDGTVKGLAVDVLNEAARRRNIELIWTPLHDIPLDDALSQGVVDMWPLVGSTPERKAKFYVTEPWLQSGYILASLEGHPIRTPRDAAGQVVAQARLRTTTLVAHKFLADSRMIVRVFRAEAIQAVCKGEAVAALVESRVVDSILLARPPGCETARFHISTLKGATSLLAIAAVPRMKVVAAALRDEITTLTTDGYLSSKLDDWSPFSAEGIRSVWAEEAANARSRIYSYCLMAALALGMVLGWLTYRARRLELAARLARAGEREAQRRFTAFMDNSPAVAFVKDVAGRLVYANHAWSQLFGLKPERCYGKTDFELFPPDVAFQLRKNDLDPMNADGPMQVIEAVPVSETESREFLVVKFPFANEQGERFLGGTAIDITQRETAVRELAASESRYRELFEHNPLPALVYDRTTLEFVAVNDAAVQTYGWTRQDFTGGMKLTDLIPAADLTISGWDAETMDRAYTKAGAWRHETRTGQLLRVELTSYELEYMQRDARLMIVRDVTEQERMIEQLRLSEERWQLALQGAGDALWDWDLVTGRVFRSPRWSLMLGYEETTNWNAREHFLKLLHPDDRDATEAAVEAHLTRKTASFVAQYRLRHKDGSWRWLMDRGQAVWDERGRAVRMAGAQTDITERKLAEDLLALEARTDALTGLANRREFDRLFAQQVQKSRTTGESLCVCVCDVDRFKEVNDSYGHAVGDRVLKAFGAILRSVSRKSDLLARIGGDEFILALPRTTLDEASALVERIRQQLHNEGFVADETTFHVSSSFGVTCLGSEHRDAAEVILEADRSLYAAKDAGRNRALTAF